MIKLDELKANGGATLNGQGEPVCYEQGYQVSAVDLETVDVPETQQELEQVLDEYLAGVALNESLNLNLGLWINKGQLYIDLSVHVADRERALSAGNKFNQLAIYDWASGQDIVLKK